MRQIGLLVPRSAIYPTINFDLLDGLKSSLANANTTDIEIKTAGIGVGGTDKEIYAACEKMLFDGVEVVIAYINPAAAVMLDPLFLNAGALLLVIGPGYHIPPSDFKPVNSYTISLDGVLACRILPAIAAANGDTDFAFTCSFYDAGYRAGFGFFNGLQAVGSGIVFNHATQLKKKDFTVAPLTAFLQANPKVALMAAACGDMTTDLFSAAEAEPEYAAHPMYAAPFVAEEIWLAKSPYPGTDVTAIVPWASTLDTAENRLFVNALKKKNRIPNVFSLLSWEAGMVVARVLEKDNIADRIACLEDYSYTGPRGTVIMDKETHSTNAPLYKAIIAENDTDGMCRLELVEELAGALVDGNRTQLLEEIRNFDGQTSSWHNVYPCID